VSTIEVFEPAMCCSTGVCGPDVPQELVDFSADFDWVRGQGQDIARFNLASEPAAFVTRPPVLQILEVSGSAALPVVLVDGVVAMAGRYPTREELSHWVGAVPEPAGRAPLAMAAAASSCCGGAGCC